MRKIRKGTGTEISHGGEQTEVVRAGGTCPFLEEEEYLPDFTPERAHLLLRGVYGY